uniref:Phosducin-like n=1 Tax=Eptatretus burgeri TaxID=7764 RepID=A0A8C4NHE8_EPTBU
MATLDDRLLGEKLDYYCSSSEDEGEDQAEHDDEVKHHPGKGLNVEGRAVNTGPKGVINDWRRYKQLEAEGKEEAKRERERLYRNLAPTVMSPDERKKLQQQKMEECEERERCSGDEEEEEFLQRYRARRMAEMQCRLAGKPMYGQVYELADGEAFVAVVDGAPICTPVAVHVWAPGVPACKALNGCFTCLAASYPSVKFCCVRVETCGASRRFERRALPALLVYRGGELVGNFPRISDQLGDDFFAGDLEGFMQEYGLLPQPGEGIDSACHPSEVGKMSTSVAAKRLHTKGRDIDG